MRQPHGGAAEVMRGGGRAFPLSARSMGHGGTGTRRPRSGCLVRETMRWGCPACARVERAAALGGRRAEPLSGDPAGRSGGKSFSEAGVAQAHTAPDARRRRWRRANAAVNGAPDHPGEDLGSRHAAQSSTLPLRLRGTRRSRSGYPLRPVAGCRAHRGWGVRHSAATPVRGGRASSAREPRRNPGGGMTAAPKWRTSRWLP